MCNAGLPFGRDEEEAGETVGEGTDSVYVQIIEGQSADADAMQRSIQRWMDELRPGATGYIGTTAGVAADGRAIAVVRFESAEAARANSERPEQGEWWADMEACYDGPVAFTESDDTEQFLAGGSNDAGFVQVMKSDAVDREAVARLDAAFERHAPSWRPDLIGGLRVWTGARSGYDVSYFTSEAEARAGESKEPPAELAKMLGEFEELMAGTEFIDLSEPWLF
jgi:hypothetical protein